MKYIAEVNLADGTTPRAVRVQVEASSAEAAWADVVSRPGYETATLVSLKRIHDRRPVALQETGSAEGSVLTCGRCGRYVLATKAQYLQMARREIPGGCGQCEPSSRPIRASSDEAAAFGLLFEVTREAERE